MKRLLFLILVLLLLTVPVLADDTSGETTGDTQEDTDATTPDPDDPNAPSSSDPVINGLVYGWSYSYNSGYASSWFYRVITELEAIETAIKNFSSGSGGSGIYDSLIYSQVVNISTDISSIRTSIGTIKGNSTSSDTTLSLIYNLLKNMDTPSSIDYSTVLNSISRDTDSIASRISTTNSTLSTISSTASTLSASVSSIESFTEDILSDVALIQTQLEHVLTWIYTDVNDIKNVIASEEDQALAETTRDEVVSITNSFAEYSFSSDHSRIYSFWSILPEWLYTDDLYDDPRYLFDAQAELFLPWLTEANNYFQSDAAAVATFSLDDPVSVRPETPYLDEWNSQLADLFRGLD